MKTTIRHMPVYLALAILFGGCIISDQITTISIYPDGSADFIKVQSNIHSSQTGSAAADELRRYSEDFIAKRDSDQAHLLEAGGQIQESRWIRSGEPTANLLVVKLPTSQALEKAFTFKGDAGQTTVAARFVKEGTRRRLSIQVTLPSDQVAGIVLDKTIHDLRANQANGLSEMRFAVVHGRIVEARGFTVAQDKQSALLEPREILTMLKTQPHAEALLVWDVTEE
jgi:hypothetical protein